MSQKTGNAKKPSVKSPLKYKPPRSLYLENCPQIQSKTKQNGKFTSNYEASRIDFETQIISSSKRALEKNKPQAGPQDLFSEFYGRSSDRFLTVFSHKGVLVKQRTATVMRTSLKKQ